LQISGLVDTKQYKKAIKSADAILKKFPEHGQTLAMKGLALNGMGKRDEAVEHVKLGLKHDLRSHLCWHVYGIIHRSDRNYPEAIKCYRNALRIDPDNQQILRDLASMQAHVRDVKGHVETRRQLLTSKAAAQYSTATTWMHFAVAHQMAGDFDMALAVVEKFESTLPTDRKPSYDTSEVVLLKVRLCEQMGDMKKALAILEDPVQQRFVVDSLTVLEQRAKLHLATGDFRTAVRLYVQLLALNQDNVIYHAGLRSALLEKAPVSTATSIHSLLGEFEQASLSAAELDVLLAGYLRLWAAHPRSRTVVRIILAFLPHDHALFVPLLSSYVRYAIRKGIPALFADIKHICRSSAASTLSWAARIRAFGGKQANGKLDACVKVAQDIMKASETNAVFDVAAANVSEPASPSALLALVGAATTEDQVQRLLATSGDGKPEDPASFPWAALLLARLQDEVGESEKAIATVEVALKHTPTVIDLYLAKGKFQKHLGRMEDAVATLEHARTLDLADRFINSKCTKYLLRADKVKQAEDTIALFVKHDSRRPEADPLEALRDLQVIWFDLEEARSLERQGLIGPALKRYVRIEKYFTDFLEDAYDFHSYCIRRSTFRVYNDLLATHDHMRSHTGFLQAAAGAARCYLRLHREPELRKSTRTGLEDAMGALSIGDKTAPTAAAADSAEKKAKDKPVDAGRDEDGNKKEIDTDPHGLKLVENATNPLQLASKYARALAEHLPGKKTAAAEAEFRASGAAPPMTSVGVESQAAVVVPGEISTVWASSAQLVASSHALVAEVALEAGSIGEAAAHALRAAETVPTAVPAAVADKLRTALQGQPEPFAQALAAFNAVAK
jgi:tetratricopeptide (TPR) repeat protein